MNAGSYSNWMIGMIFLIPLIQAEEIEEWLDSAKFCTSCVITYTSYFSMVLNYLLSAFGANENSQW
jgi:hypothetical protein